MRKRVRQTVLVVVLAIAASVGTLVGAADPAGAQSGAQVAVTPTTDLLDEQVVAVSGSGFSPNTTVYISMCPPGASQPFDCDIGAVQTASTDSTGSFDTEYQVVRYVQRGFGSPNYLVDCALVTCSLGVADGYSNPPNTVLVPVQFQDTGPTLPPPTVTATPATGLLDGQQVTVAATGLRPYEPAEIRQCPPGATTVLDCATPAATPSADAAGDLATEVALTRVLSDSDAYLDCAVAACSIGFQSLSGFQTVAIDFAEPALTIEIEGLATLKAGTNDAVARATISCDISTPVTVYASITQSGVDYRYRLIDNQCAPGQPLDAFLPGRLVWDNTSDFQLGTANVSVSARSVKRLNVNDPPSVATDVSAPVQLIDHDAVAAAIAVGLADPSNTELREQLLAAIALRVAQDPIFRAEFRAALSGGS